MTKKIATKENGIRNKYHFQSTSGNTQIRLVMDLSRFEDNYQKAQFAMDSMVMKSMIPYMPRQTGTFINVTKAMSASLAGSGTVVAAAPPMGRYLYEGKVMVGEETKRPWAKAGERKEVTSKPLTYGNPKAQPHWFDVAKANHGDAWVRVAKKIAGGG